MYTFRANIANSSIPEDTTRSQILNDTLTELARNQVDWSENRMVGYDFLYYNSIETHQILPGNGDVLSYLKAITSKWSEFISGYPGYEIVQNNYTLFANQSAYEAGTADITSRNNPVGVGALPASRLIPRSFFASPQAIDKLVKGMLQGMQNARGLNSSDNGVAFGIYKVTPANTPDLSSTPSANPAWRKPSWHVIVDGGWEQGFSPSAIEAVKKYVRFKLGGLESVLGEEQACYANEADYGEMAWQDVFFGDHCERLLGIKGKYHPETMFNCWKCVGWLGEGEKMYSCYEEQGIVEP